MKAEKLVTVREFGTRNKIKIPLSQAIKNKKGRIKELKRIREERLKKCDYVSDIDLCLENEEEILKKLINKKNK